MMAALGQYNALNVREEAYFFDDRLPAVFCCVRGHHTPPGGPVFRGHIPPADHEL